MPLLTLTEFAKLGFATISHGIKLILHAAKAMKPEITGIVSANMQRGCEAMSALDYPKVVDDRDRARLQESYSTD